MKSSLTLAIFGSLAAGLTATMAAPQPSTDWGLAGLQSKEAAHDEGTTLHMLPGSGILPTCKPRTDVCDVPSWISQCIPGTGNVFVGAEKWKFCNWKFRNVLADPKHCNACNAACPTTAPYCVSGVCRTHAPVTVDLRVEGNDADGTIFEGKVITSGRDLTTPTGGDGECDATYYNGNQVPMGTTTTALDDAARLNNFGWDGYYYGSLAYYDWIVQKIANTQETPTQAWVPLLNGSFFGTGACMYAAQPSDKMLWAYDVLRTGALVLELTGPDFVRKGQAATYTVTGKDPRTKAVQPVAGAKVRDKFADANGKVTITYDHQCIYYLKASKQGNIRSNAVWTVVL